MNSKGSVSPSISRTRMRLAVLCAAGAMFLFLVISSRLLFGIAIPTGIYRAAAATLMGLTTWWTYHLVSGRCDSSLLLMVFPPAIMQAPLTLTPLLRLLVFYQLFAVILGLILRRYERRKAAGNPGPLYDPQIDHVA